MRWWVTVSRTIEQRSAMMVNADTPTEAMDRALDYAKTGISWHDHGPALTGPSPSVLPVERMDDGVTPHYNVPIIR